MRPMFRSILTCAMICSSVVVSAQTPNAPPRAPQPAAPGPSLALALEAAQTALSTCAANGYKVAVTVLDSSGAPRVVLAADGVGARAIEFSQRKANTVLKYGEPSAVIQEKVKTDTTLAATITADNTLVARAGAQPIKSKGVLIGAIGVGGAPGGEKDDVCTSAALEKIKDRL